MPSCARRYILQIMLWHQSLKSIQNIINFPEQKTTDLRVQTWGGGIKDISPHDKTWGDTSPTSPQDLRPCTPLKKCEYFTFFSAFPLHLKILVEIIECTEPSTCVSVRVTQ